jgi:type II secretory pathway component GspD/PulD (secretin)
LSLTLIAVLQAVSIQTASSAANSSDSQSSQPAVLSLAIVKADRAAEIVHRLYPRATIRVDKSSNSVIVIAKPDDLNAIRTIVTALDVRNPQAEQTEVIPVSAGAADTIASRMKGLFPRARFSTNQKRMLLVTASSYDLAQIHTLVSALDSPTPAPSASPPLPGTAFAINQASPQLVARAVARALPKSQVSVAGSSIIVRGSPEDVQQVKALLEQIDRPPENSPYVAVYRLSSVDATSVADLLSRSFPKLTFVVTKDINALSVSATAFEQARISSAVSQLDVAPSTASGAQSSALAGSARDDFEVLALHAAVPASGNGGSTTATDIAQTVLQALGPAAPDLKITVQPNSTKLILTGSSRSRELAKRLITDLDVAEPLVELDTRVLEVDEGSQTQLGLKFPTPVLASTYSETTPTSTTTAAAPQLLRLQGLTRTPLTLEAQLDFLISSNQAKILEDPRITTFSGRTATLRAGETVNILTTAGGSSGTVATTQIQSFQTGVTLDITPVVNADNYITVTLHPSVNSIAGVGASGVPDIQTRDTTTTIGLQDGETLIIGGLIEDTDTKTIQKIPLLGDLPLIGRLFQDVGTSHARNELVVTVTPHILKHDQAGSVTRLSMLPDLPKISAEATLPPIKSPIVDASPLTSPVVSRLSEVSSPPSSPTPIAAQTPIPLPTAFADANSFVYGSAPANNFADADQPPQIFFAKVQPTVVKSGTPVTVSILTTTNVTSVSLGTTSSPKQMMLSAIGPGRWQSTFAFDPTPLPSTAGNVSETLTATTAQGTSTTIRIPFSLIP